MTDQNIPQKKPYIDYTELYIDPVARQVELMNQAKTESAEKAQKKTTPSGDWVDYTELYIDPVARQVELMNQAKADKSVRHVRTVIDDVPEGGGLSIRVFFRRGDDVRSVVVDLGIDWNDRERSEQPYHANISSSDGCVAGD